MEWRASVVRRWWVLVVVCAVDGPSYLCVVVVVYDENMWWGLYWCTV